VSVIVISWFTSPLLSSIGAAILFLFTRHAVLRRKNSYVLSLWMLPLFAFLTVYVGCYYIIQKGPKLVIWTSSCMCMLDCVITNVAACPCACCKASTAALFVYPPLCRLTRFLIPRMPGSLPASLLAPAPSRAWWVCL
jgi:phosphate/sulfate permease